MNITRIRCYRPERHNPSLSQSDMVVLVETDAGITGIGEGGSPDTVAQCAAMLIGADPHRIQHLWQLLYRGFFYPAGREKLHAIGALDLALWDIKGKALGVPVYELLGGLARDHIECYSTAFPWQGDQASTARACVEAGFRAYRTSVADPAGAAFHARRMVDVTSEQCRAIAEGVGAQGEWCIDFHTRLDMPDAIRLCSLIEGLNPLFVEDPLRSENADALAMLRSQVRVPLAVGEQFGDRWDSNTLLERRLTDYLRVTLPNVGGITELLKIAVICETHYVGLVPHFTGPIATAALVHVMAAQAVPVMMEILGGALRQPPHLAQAALFRDGKLWPNAAPGLGVEFVEQNVTLLAEISEYAAPVPQLRRPDGSYTNWGVGGESGFRIQDSEAQRDARLRWSHRGHRGRSVSFGCLASRVSRLAVSRSACRFLPRRARRARSRAGRMYRASWCVSPGAQRRVSTTSVIPHAQVLKRRAMGDRKPADGLLQIDPLYAHAQAAFQRVARPLTDCTVGSLVDASRPLGMTRERNVQQHGPRTSSLIEAERLFRGYSCLLSPVSCLPVSCLPVSCLLTSPFCH
ncbi:mandelate racemase/muconate lactonizing enzyme family protein [Candidatus Gracilibacteria bacterium]|nr:mandelate racemase/muconate lactonizing enzyme family protein [Candidatus Gracilibacteria bacterium]